METFLDHDTLDHGRQTADEMDEDRTKNMAYEYLCHLEEAKVWIEVCINEDLPATVDLEKGLQNGVYLAKLAHFFASNVVPLKKIYDKDQSRYQSRGLHFRHTDNINHWLRAMDEVGLPKIFYPETTDIYDKKNMPRAVYCVHALSLFLFKLGIAPQIQDLFGKIRFTDEEINVMRNELDKYGIQMPTFSKIGGILASEMSLDEAELHAAVIAINEAIDRQDPDNTYHALKNPSAMLISLDWATGEEYQDQLFTAKRVKLESSQNRLKGVRESVQILHSPSYVLCADTTSVLTRGADDVISNDQCPHTVELAGIVNGYQQDVYDVLLTQAEIQGNIQQRNVVVHLQKLQYSLQQADCSMILSMLKSPVLELSNVVDDNIDFYRDHLMSACETNKGNNEDSSDTELPFVKEDLQVIVDKANQEANDALNKKDIAMAANSAIDRRDLDTLIQVLHDLVGFHSLECHDFAAPLYMEELSNIKAEKKEDLDYDEIVAAMLVLNGVVVVNLAASEGSVMSTYLALSQPHVHLPEVTEVLTHIYQASLIHRISLKEESKVTNRLLTHGEIVDCVESVHEEVQLEQDRVVAVKHINNAIDEGDDQQTVAALATPVAQIEGVVPSSSLYYHSMLTREKMLKAERTDDAEADLWLDEIQSAVHLANQYTDHGLKVSLAVRDVNHVVKGTDSELLGPSLTNSAVFQNVKFDCIPLYLERLKQYQSKKSLAGDCGSGWMMNRLRDGTKFFYNIHTHRHTWSRTDDIAKDFSLLTSDDIQVIVDEITAEHNRAMLFKANEDFIVTFQAVVRGYVVRKKLHSRMDFLKQQSSAVVTIQAFYLGCKQRRLYRERLRFMKQNLPSIVKLQAYFRMWRQRKRYLDRKQYYKDNEDSIILLQAFFRSNMARSDYISLMYDDDVSLGVVGKFLHLLGASDNDYNEELELHRLQQQVVTEIRSNEQLEEDLDEMDIKIGLLIKNRITLQDVVSHHRKLNKKSDDDVGGSGVGGAGLKALSRDRRERMEAYQHMFYLLQTSPFYLAKLIFEMPHSSTTKFMESVIFSLFSYGSNQREEYLLLKLFRSALEEEINSKVENMMDIVTGNPLVVKMIVRFNRGQGGQSALVELLGPLITKVLSDKDLHINTNPIEVYKAYINHLESSTGMACDLPYEVTTEQALQHPEVKRQIQECVKQLQSLTEMFLNRIVTSLNSIPYGMLYMAKVMREALMDRFPDAQEKDVLKIVGNLLYYRYINSAIVAPDAFNIVSIGVEKALSRDQRRNLACIAKILQFAASNKGFGGESEYLADMNPFIRQSHERFRNYFLEACQVVEPEERFNIDRYSDIVKITKPVIHISVGEIVNTHTLLLQHRDKIAPDVDDPIHDLLDDLGEVPTIDELMGTQLTNDEATNNHLRSQLANTGISMTLSEPPGLLHTHDDSDMQSLFVRTKRMVVDIIACQPGDSLTAILCLPVSSIQEETYRVMRKDREVRFHQTEKAGTVPLHASILDNMSLSLEQMKSKVRGDLQALQLAGLVSQEDDYQDLINDIVMEIRNQRHYRKHRMQELVRIRNTQRGLNEKRVFFESQIDYYNQYVRTCLGSLQAATRKRGRSVFKRNAARVKCVRYSASQLLEKGVLLMIEGLPTNQFKNVQFDISTTDTVGVFDVEAIFMGVKLEKVKLVFQDLLQLQYDGVSVMKMFNRAKVNVNLLVFLINKKFYG